MRPGAYESLDPEVEQIARLIVDSTFVVHSSPGPGLLENICEPFYVTNL
jgi:hypothetical protein